jgi:hypothetical protein
MHEIQMSEAEEARLFGGMYSINAGWAVRTWLIQNDDGGTVVQASLSDVDDHVYVSCFGHGVDVSEAQGNALRLLYAMGVHRG